MSKKVFQVTKRGIRVRKKRKGEKPKSGDIVKVLHADDKELIVQVHVAKPRMMFVMSQ